MDGNSLQFNASPIKFGTDGWRGVLGVDITLQKMMLVAAAAAQELSFRYINMVKNPIIVVGYDRRFLAPEFAEAISAAIGDCELEPLLTNTPVPTPACSWAVVKHNALGALIVTASHNPSEWIGLKIKGPMGGSVDNEFTKAVENRISLRRSTVFSPSTIKFFDGRNEHIDGLKAKIDIPKIIKGIEKMGLQVIVDPMHGSAAKCISDLFNGKGFVQEIRGWRDPLFGGNPPEPLSRYLSELIKVVKNSSTFEKPAIGIVFDGDGDRIAAVDENGRFCSAQLLMPLLIYHLAKNRNLPGCVIKTVSGSDLMRLVAEDLGREVLEFPVGFKHIAEAMNNKDVLIGGEESGGIGFGFHIPERDALFVSLLLLESLAETGQTLAQSLEFIKNKYGDSYYERIDVKLDDISSKENLEDYILKFPPSIILNQPIKEIIKIDGLKLVLDERHWLMFRFSGTEPLLRIYCEAPNREKLDLSLSWAKEFTKEVLLKSL